RHVRAMGPGINLELGTRRRCEREAVRGDRRAVLDARDLDPRYEEVVIGCGVRIALEYESCLLVHPDHAPPDLRILRCAVGGSEFDDVHLPSGDDLVAGDTPLITIRVRTVWRL